MTIAGDAQLKLEDVPVISSGFRLQWEPAQQAHVLLYPEGMVKLSASAAEIMRRVDGVSTVGAIIADLERSFPGAELRADVIAFLATARERGWIGTKA
ncbi:MAG TPA: pyrroloquinoline quinone biosynthesis peptide chaperone PqqD [Candidatus Binataceae bacterium]|nr:pyrroloquinoline quinone biosynthesis peptide chaperone PqqD [Candidatus Binataceae bacterium]